jgi:TolB-like protein
MHAVIALGLGLLLAAGGEKPKLLVLDVQATGGATEALAQSVTQAVISEAISRGFYSVISSRDLGSLMGVERQKQLLGCGEDSNSCMAELAGAMAARFVLTGNVSRFGDALQLNLQLFDNQKSGGVARATRLAKSESDLRTQVIYAVAEATGSPLPPPPSKVLPIGLIAAGSAAVLFGAVLGIVTLTSEATMGAELNQGAMFPQVLKSYDYYQSERNKQGVQRTVSLVSMIAGALLVAGGVYLFPPDVVASSSLKVAWLAGPGGFAVAGSF